MEGDMFGLLSQHHLAHRFGVGLKPRLLQVLARDVDHQSPHVVALNAPQHSSGPARQPQDPQTLQALGIAHIGEALDLKTRRDGTDG